ncbi:MAG: hypothetical protein IPI84_11630 [Holophagaceae bacterium]|nr:hypothetical protein [Holophagaceae bacterium]
MHRCYFIPITDLTNRADLPGWVAALARSGESEEDTRKAVVAILADVRRDGLPAVLDWTERLDGVRLDPKPYAFRCPLWRPPGPTWTASGRSSWPPSAR